MNSNYLPVVGLAIGMLLISGPTFSQTTIHGCSPNTLSLCVNDPGVSLPDNNQFIVGVGTAGATSCSVHVQQIRTISSTCGGVIHYSIALVIDTVKYFIQPLTSISIDSSGQVLFVLDTRLSEDAWIRNNGIPYNPECGDEYIIEWYVSDECGGEDYCEELLQLYDCQVPAITMISGVSTIHLPSCLLHLYASDFLDNIVDDCLPQNEFLLSMTADSFVPDMILDYCEFGFNVEATFPLWVADQGRDINCNGNIEWDERRLFRQDMPIILTENGVCECYDNYIISGKVYTEMQRPLNMVEVNLAEPWAQYPTYVTGDDGEYFFNKPHGEFQDVTISASRNDNHRNGVSTLDVVKIQKHLLMVDTLDSPYKIIAADANSSNSVTAIDLIELRKLILGVYPVLPNSPSWRFIDAKYVFPEPFNPFTWLDSFPIDNPYNIVIPYATDLGDQDFIGVKIGDVNHTIRGNLQSVVVRNDPAATWHTPDQSYATGDIVSIPMLATTPMTLQGFQFTLQAAGLKILEVQSEVCNITEEAYFLMNDQMTVSWFDVAGVQVNTNDKLFTIIARATQPGSLTTTLDLNSSITSAELFDTQDNMFTPALHILQSQLKGLQLLPASPNPFSEVTAIPFYVREDVEVTINVSTVDGTVLLSNTMNSAIGRNEFVLHADQIAASGMLIVSLQAGDEVQYQKVMLVK